MNMHHSASGGPEVAPNLAGPTVLGHDLLGVGSQHVLVLHSWMGNARSFDLMKPYLDTDKFTFAFADLRGYGRSRAVLGNYTLGEAAEDALVLANNLGWDRFHVVGHSMSGMVMQRMLLDDACRSRRRIASAVGVTPVTASGFPADEETRLFLWNLVHDETLTMQGISLLTSQRLPAAWVRALARDNIATSDPDAMRGYYRMWIEGDFSDEVAHFRPDTPLRVIGGRQDLPGFAEAHYRATLATWFPNIDLQFISDAGHFPMYETPPLLAAMIEAHLSAHAVGSDGALVS